MLAILGRSSDDLVREVHKRVCATGFKNVLVDQDRPFVTVDGNDLEASTLDEGKSKLGDVTFVWNRTKLAPMARATDPFEPMEPNEYRVRRNEWRAIVSAFTILFEQSAFNPEFARLRAEQKLLQQKVARLSGFRTLPSIVTTQKASADEFARLHPTLVGKALGAPTVSARSSKNSEIGANYSLLATTRMDQDDILCSPPELFEIIPVWLQKRITSGEELRVIAFSDKVFAYKAPYSFSDRKITDIRFADFHYKHFTSNDVNWHPIFQYLELMGLDYGVFDLGIDDSGLLIFLECNPEGMWHSINGTGTENEVLDAFSDHLIDVAVKRARK